MPLGGPFPILNAGPGLTLKHWWTAVVGIRVARSKRPVPGNFILAYFVDTGKQTQIPPKVVLS